MSVDMQDAWVLKPYLQTFARVCQWCFFEGGFDHRAHDVCFESLALAAKEIPMPTDFVFPSWLRRRERFVSVHCVSEEISDDPWHRVPSLRRSARHVRIVSDHIGDASRSGLPCVRQLRVTLCSQSEAYIKRSHLWNSI